MRCIQVARTGLQARLDIIISTHSVPEYTTGRAHRPNWYILRPCDAVALAAVCIHGQRYDQTHHDMVEIEAG